MANGNGNGNGHGGPRPGAGRKPKAINVLKLKALAEAEGDAEYAFAFVIACLRNPELPVDLRLDCAKEVMDRRWGKSVQSVRMEATKQFMDLYHKWDEPIADVTGMAGGRVLPDS